MLSLILGAGALATGFFGMNFGREFAKVFLDPVPPFIPLHYATVLAVVLLAVGALIFGFYVVISNWTDYKEILTPRAPETPKRRGGRDKSKAKPG